MNQDKNATFKQSGYLLEKGLFKKSETVVFEQEFDKIISQLTKSGENINARWGSGLTKKLESQKSKVIHTHNVQSFSSIMLDCKILVTSLSGYSTCFKDTYET